MDELLDFDNFVAQFVVCFIFILVLVDQSVELGVFENNFGKVATSVEILDQLCVWNVKNKKKTINCTSKQ